MAPLFELFINAWSMVEVHVKGAGMKMISMVRLYPRPVRKEKGNGKSMR